MRGGARPGAGRPRKHQEPMVTVSFYGSQQTRDRLADLRREGIPIIAELEQYITDRWTACEFTK